jgi:hypothetical protein
MPDTDNYQDVFNPHFLEEMEKFLTRALFASIFAALN